MRELQTKGAIKKKVVKVTSEVLNAEILRRQHYWNEKKLARPKNWTNQERDSWLRKNALPPSEAAFVSDEIGTYL